MSTKVYRYRVKSLNGLLNKQARAVNFVWNFCHDTQKHALKWCRRWPTGFDLNVLTTGCSKEPGIHSGTINAVCEQYARSRKQFNRPFLRYRGKRSLGWVPMKGRDLRRHGNAFRFAEDTCFAQDRRGNWFLNIVVEVTDVEIRKPARGVGIDLGLADLATLSSGQKIEHPRHYRRLEEKLAAAQRARKRKQTASIHARIANSRADFLHKASAQIVREFDYIVVGNVSPSKLARTSMAKSVLDAGWHCFKTMLAYKSIANGAWYEEVNEAFSSQTCSACGALPESRPKGIAGLRIREWVCSECGTVHDRDVNAALNNLRSGHRAPVVGILVL